MQRGVASERAGVLGCGRLGAVRLPGIASAWPAPCRPNLRLCRAGSSPARWTLAGPGMSGSAAHESAAAACVLGSPASPAVGRRLGGARLAVSVSGAGRRSQGRPYGRVPGRIRASSWLPAALGPSPRRAALLRSGRSRGLQRHRLAARAANGAPVAEAPGPGLLLSDG